MASEDHSHASNDGVLQVDDRAVILAFRNDPEHDRSRYVASDAGTRLTFDELFEKIKSNDVRNVNIDIDNLTEEQLEAIVLRACHLNEVLSGFGRQLRSIDAGEQHFALSRPVSMIDEFLSHAWLTGRCAKTLTLLYHYNFKLAGMAYLIVGTLSFGACFMIGGGFHCDFQVCDPTLLHGTRPFAHASAWAMFSVPLAAFLLVFRFGVHLRCGLAPSVFLDKLCIQQTNPGLKVLGVKSLEIFVRRSRRLVLLYDTYTYERLWCSFESAMFAHDRDCSTADFRFVPISLAMYAVGFAVANMLGLLWCALTLEHLSTHMEDAQKALLSSFQNKWVLRWIFCCAPVSAAFVYLPCGYLIERRCDDMIRMHKSLAEFCMDKTKCRDENDRTHVYQRIEQTWGSLSKFDDFVRNDVAKAITGTAGHANYIPYIVRMTMSAPFMWLICWAGMNSGGEASLHGFHYLFAAASWCFIVGPMELTWRFKLGSLVYSRLHKFRVLCTLGIAKLSITSFSMHFYVHTNLLIVCARVFEQQQWTGFGLLPVLPVLGLEALCMFFIERRSKRVQADELITWTRVDTAYYACWTTVMICFLAGFNVAELVAVGFLA